MTECEREGIAGNCGPDRCHKYRREGGCEEYDADNHTEEDTPEKAYERAMGVL